MQLGKLSYTAADGTDDILVGGNGSPIGNSLGVVSLKLGNGGTGANGIAFEDIFATSISMTAGDGDENVSLRRVFTQGDALAPPVTVNGGVGDTTVSFAFGAFGATKISASGEASLL